MSGELPNGWIETTLGALGRWSSGGTPNSKITSYYDGAIPWVKTGDLRDAPITEIEQTITQSGLDNSSAKIFPKKTLLIAMYGATIGRLGVLQHPAATNQACAALLPAGLTTDLLPYLFYYLLGQRTNLRSVGKGGAQPNISQEILKEYPCPLAPIPEQHRIVEKIDSLFSRSTRAREELAHIPRLIERYRQAVLEAAFRGDLTADWRDKSDGISIDTEHTESQPWTIPGQWQWQHVRDIGEVGLGRQRSPINHQGPFMRPYIRAANITWNGWDLSDVKEMNFDDADFARFQLCPGDVLINEGSGSAKEVGKPAIWQGQIKDCCFQNTLIRVQPQECTSEYLYFYFLFLAISERFVTKTQGVNIYHIGKEGLASFPIPLPPRPEQQAIVTLIKSVLESISRMKDEFSRASDLIQRLDQSILDKAFSGQLVPQDPTDEPAAVLLDRIKAARSGSSVVRRGRRKPGESPDIRNADEVFR